MKQVLFIIFVLAFAAFLFFARRWKCNEYNQSAINGAIDNIHRYRDYVMITIDGQEFRVIPVPVDNRYRLDAIAQIGDSILKKANADTLLLKHGTNKYLFTVQKW